MATSPLNSINWKLLRDQKLSLLQVIGQIEDEDEKNSHNLIGILHLIDEIQEYAVSDLGQKESDVFMSEDT